MAQLFAGTSGFAYPSWKPAFYPEKLASAKFLNHYATRLNCVEINYTFRRLPPLSALEKWVQDTAPGFLFAPKAHQRITHIYRLKNAAQAVDVFLKAVDPLRSARRIGPVLFQLPPNLKCDAALLGDFLATLPDDMRFAVEFRHESWLNDATYQALSDRGVSLCLAESETLEIPEVITAGFVYYRLRKPEYTDAEVAAIGDRCAELLSSGKDLYLFFKHEDSPDGALHAEKLLERFRS